MLPHAGARAPPAPAEVPKPPSPPANPPSPFYKFFSNLSTSEKVGYALVAVPLLPLAIAFGPILVMHAALERDNAKYYQGAPAPRPTVTLYSPPSSPARGLNKTRRFWHNKIAHFEICD